MNEITTFLQIPYCRQDSCFLTSTACIGTGTAGLITAAKLLVHARETPEPCHSLVSAIVLGLGSVASIAVGCAHVFLCEDTEGVLQHRNIIALN